MAIVLLSIVFAVLVFFAVGTGEFSIILTSILFGIFLVLNILQETKMAKLDRGKKLKRDINWGAFILVYVALVFFGVMLGLLIGNIYDRANSESTTGIVSRIEHDNTSDDTETCTGYAKYVVDGKEYESKYTSSSIVCNKKIGSKVKIYYRKDKPEKLTTNSYLFVLIFGTLFTGFFLVLVIIKLYKSKKGRRRKK